MPIIYLMHAWSTYSENYLTSFDIVYRYLTCLIRRPFKPAIFFFNRRSADVLTRIPFFESFAGSRVNTPHVAVTFVGWCVYMQVFLGVWENTLRCPPDKRHWCQWMSSLFCGFFQPQICKDGFISIVFDVSLECCLFDRVRADNRPVFRSLQRY